MPMSRNRRLAVLLVTSSISKEDNITTIGYARPLFSDPEFVDYAELLSASNIPFDVIEHKEINYETFVENNFIKYAVVIITIPFHLFSDKQVSILKEVSYDSGVSLIASYTNTDRRSYSFFGINTYNGKSLLWPLKVKIVHWPTPPLEKGGMGGFERLSSDEIVVNYGLSSGLPGIRKRGFKKLSLKKSFIKILGLVRSSLLPYVRMKLEPGINVLAKSIKGVPLSWSSQFGKATNYYFALHGDLFLDQFNEMHRLVRAAIEANSGFGMVSADIESTMVLRIDDPGACSTAYLDSGSILEEEDWNDIGTFLRTKNISMSVMYTPEWIDHGDKKAGTLLIDNHEIKERKPGAIYDSALVRYLHLNGKEKTYDHQSEYRGLKRYSDEGLIDIHSHGLTHLVPDYDSWAKSGIENKDPKWYREFYHVKNDEKVDRGKQLYAMINSKKKIDSLFGVNSSVLAPSGHSHDEECDLLAYKSGYHMLSSDYTSYFRRDLVIRNWKIPGIFLYLKDPSPFSLKSGYPFIGIIHDYEIKEGIERFKNIINNWSSTGIKRIISLSDLTSLLCADISAVYSEKESNVEILIDLNGNVRESFRTKQPTSYKFSLRCIIPRNMTFSKNTLSISEGCLDSVTTNNFVTTMNLTIKNRSIASIKLPLSIKQMS